MSADSVAMYTLGHMSLNSGLPEQQLVAFWAPFLLLHLGGQDTIAAYAVEDNRLWMHDLQSFAVQVAAAGYVLYKSSASIVVAGNGNHQSTLLCTVWALKCANANAGNDDNSRLVRGMDVIPGQRKSRRARGQSSDGDAEGLLLEAHLLFDICKRLIKGPGVAVAFREDQRRLLAVSLSSTAGQCHREQQQSQRFHHLHPVTRGQHPGDHFGAEGSLIRLDVGALVSTGMDTHRWTLFMGQLNMFRMCDVRSSKDDEIRIYFVLETLLFWKYFEKSDYSIPLAGVHRRSGEQVSGTSAFDVLHRDKAAIRFLGSASRDCSLFVRDGSPSSPLACFAPSSTLAAASSSCRATGLSATSVVACMGLQDWWNTKRHSWFISIPAAVMRTEATNLDDEVGRHRGRVTLRRWGLFEELGWSVGNEDDGDQASSFASSILLWHIATDVYLKLYRKEIDQDEGQRALVEAIKTLANYMFFLLVVRPQMLPAGSVEQQQQYATKLRAVELGKSDLLAGTFCASFWLSVSRIVRGMIGRKLSTFEHAPNDRCTLGGVPVLCGLRKPNA
uniref:OSJNBb0040D15.9 protein n=2 Tax=Oryza sativa subsp. japonica TaxID=39947 RepID=Q7XMW5_ORYSJ|nr:OSJNBb0040D15.9 [Oryza sativa Japonica Group]